jgi:hypothetical protein
MAVYLDFKRNEQETKKKMSRLKAYTVPCIMGSLHLHSQTGKCS